MFQKQNQKVAIVLGTAALSFSFPDSNFGDRKTFGIDPQSTPSTSAPSGTEQKSEEKASSRDSGASPVHKRSTRHKEALRLPTTKNTDLFILNSEDGVSSRNASRLFIENASAADLIRLPSGTILLFCDRVAEPSKDSSSAIEMSRSTDGGNTWTKLQKISIRNSSGETVNGRHPDVVLTSEGLFLFYTTDELSGSKEKSSKRAVIKMARFDSQKDCFIVDDRAKIPFSSKTDLHASAYYWNKEVHLLATIANPKGDKSKPPTKRERYAIANSRFEFDVMPVPEPLVGFLGNITTVDKKQFAFGSSGEKLFSFELNDEKYPKIKEGKAKDGFDPAVLKTPIGYLTVCCKEKKDEPVATNEKKDTPELPSNGEEFNLSDTVGSQEVDASSSELPELPNAVPTPEEQKRSLANVYDDFFSNPDGPNEMGLLEFQARLEMATGGEVGPWDPMEYPDLGDLVTAYGKSLKLYHEAKESDLDGTEEPLGDGMELCKHSMVSTVALLNGWQLDEDGYVSVDKLIKAFDTVATNMGDISSEGPDTNMLADLNYGGQMRDLLKNIDAGAWYAETPEQIDAMKKILDNVQPRSRSTSAGERQVPEKIANTKSRPDLEPESKKVIANLLDEMGVEVKPGESVLDAFENASVHSTGQAPEISPSYAINLLNNLAASEHQRARAMLDLHAYRMKNGHWPTSRSEVPEIPFDFDIVDDIPTLESK